MSTVLLICLLIISIIMTGLILIQHSEGGALGIGGGGGGGLMSGRSAANSVQRMTWILGTIFLVVCLGLSVIMTQDANQQNILEKAGEVAASDNSQENSTSSTNEALTDEVDSGETTDPLADANEAVESGNNSEETTEESSTEPAETPQDE